MVPSWFTDNWVDIVQTIGVVAGFLFTAYTLRRDERARETSNLLALKQQYNDLWQEFYSRPTFSPAIRSVPPFGMASRALTARFMMSCSIIPLSP